jgi:acetylornithine/succinyldiaminopimelate/putrescine aminotransferase
VEIKVGIKHVSREVTVESEMSSDEVLAALDAALTDGGVLTLTDEKGRKVLIPAAGIAYVELGAEHSRRVGFGAL